MADEEEFPRGFSGWSREQWAQWHSRRAAAGADAGATAAAETAGTTAEAGAEMADTTAGSAAAGTGAGTGSGRRKFNFLDGSFQRELKAQKGQQKGGEPRPPAPPAPCSGWR